jgi:hypothetical protein
LTAKPSDLKKFWLDHPDFKANIEHWWRESEPIKGTLIYHFQHRLKNLKIKLKTWNKQVLGNIFQAQKDLEKLMEEV